MPASSHHQGGLNCFSLSREYFFLALHVCHPPPYLQLFLVVYVQLLKKDGSSKPESPLLSPSVFHHAAMLAIGLLAISGSLWICVSYFAGVHSRRGKVCWAGNSTTAHAAVAGTQTLQPWTAPALSTLNHPHLTPTSTWSAPKWARSMCVGPLAISTSVFNTHGGVGTFVPPLEDFWQQTGGSAAIGPL